jgi:hypothetical protein
VLIRHLFVTLSAAAVLGLSLATIPAQADTATELAPTGCTTSIEWVHEGNNHYYGKGNIQCASGRYRAKNTCRDNQSGLGYVVYGTQVVDAPAVATVTCNPGNTAEAVHAVEDPPPAGVAGCAPWVEWIHDVNGAYYGKGNIQCDTGRYRIKNVCRDNQSGLGYIIYGEQVADAPNVATTNCGWGHTAESVHAVADPPPEGVTGCTSWIEWVHDGTNHYFGRGKAQCDTGVYTAQTTCRNLQTGEGYVVNSTNAAGAPDVAIATCNSGNVAETVQAIPSALPPSDPGPWGFWLVEP